MSFGWSDYETRFLVIVIGSLTGIVIVNIIQAF